MLYPSPEDSALEASAGVVAGSDGDVVTASHAPTRTDDQTRFVRYLHHLTEVGQFPCNPRQNNPKKETDEKSEGP